jgi:hypothetical protein
MKRKNLVTSLIPVALIIGLFFINISVSAQLAITPVSSIPADVNKILTASCTPCHTSQGGLMSKAKLNLTEWDKYSPEKQKAKAAKIYSEINKGGMPPKMARQKRPDLIPTKEQADVIKKWAEALPSGTK